MFPCPAIFDKYPDLLPLVVEYATTIEGAVRVPGPYPVLAGHAGLRDHRRGRGLTREADMKRVEMTHYAADGDDDSERRQARSWFSSLRRELASIAVSPGDVVRFNPIITDRDIGTVALLGQFRRPGHYDITRGEHLSELIARAGGLTDPRPIPMARVFTRESVQDGRSGRNTFARPQQLQSGLTAAIHEARLEQSQSLVSATQQLVTEIRGTTPRRPRRRRGRSDRARR